jgi:hypothetical protein
VFYEVAFFLELHLLGKPTTNAPQIRKTKNMKLLKAMIADAAIGGLLSGSVTVQHCMSRVQSKAGIPLRTLADEQKGKHSCGCNGRAERPIDHPS